MPTQEYQQRNRIRSGIGAYKKPRIWMIPCSWLVFYNPTIPHNPTIYRWIMGKNGALSRQIDYHWNYPLTFCGQKHAISFRKTQKTARLSFIKITVLIWSNFILPSKVGEKWKSSHFCTKSGCYYVFAHMLLWQVEKWISPSNILQFLFLLPMSFLTKSV